MSSAWEALETKVVEVVEVEDGRVGVERFSVPKVEWLEVKEGVYGILIIRCCRQRMCT